ncbi:MAG TPA: potassium-transporting ATPase subunit KdpC [Candidatus Acidoferrum sp.]|nr:potassium-transporting ATPase subunit KdpC [Candidatus Acidoferrum sp.]
MREHLNIAFRFTILTTILFGLLYPLGVTGLSHLAFPRQANGSLIISKDGTIAGSDLIGQPFTSAKYFHSRPSSAGAGYDATASTGSNLGPTNKQLIDRVHADVTKLEQENPGEPIPADLVTSSGSGLDPHISPASAAFQIPRIAKARGISPDQLKALVLAHLEKRQFGLLGEARINTLQLNLDLEAKYPTR